MQTDFKVELKEHLGYEPYAATARVGHHRNGSYGKPVTTDVGQVGCRCLAPGWDLRAGDDYEHRFERAS